MVIGSSGLVGSEAVAYFAGLGFDVVGIDNDMRSRFFGPDAKTSPSVEQLKSSIPTYKHYETHIRDGAEIDRIFEFYDGSIELVVHTAAQPSPDWTAREPLTDFTVHPRSSRMC